MNSADCRIVNAQRRLNNLLGVLPTPAPMPIVDKADIAHFKQVYAFSENKGIIKVIIVVYALGNEMQVNYLADQLGPLVQEVWFCTDEPGYWFSPSLKETVAIYESREQTEIAGIYAKVFGLMSGLFREIDNIGDNLRYAKASLDKLEWKGPNSNPKNTNA